MIEYLVEQIARQLAEFSDFMRTNYDPIRDTVDIALVFLAVYWLLLLIKGTRAVQILAGLMALIAARLISELFQLMTLTWILDAFFYWGWVIIIVVFQADIRRVLARVGRGFFPELSELKESHILEEIVRASQTLAQKRVGALIVLERENSLEDLVEAGTPIDAEVSKELLTSVFLPYSPLHDGAVVIREGRITHAGSILPLTLRADLPEGVGTRHRAAVGITEESDAVVIVVSEETATISVVMAGEMTRDLDAPRLRVVLRDILRSAAAGVRALRRARRAEAQAPRCAPTASPGRRGRRKRQMRWLYARTSASASRSRSRVAFLLGDSRSSPSVERGFDVPMVLGDSRRPRDRRPEHRRGERAHPGHARRARNISPAASVPGRGVGAKPGVLTVEVDPTPIELRAAREIVSRSPARRSPLRAARLEGGEWGPRGCDGSRLRARVQTSRWIRPARGSRRAARK
jgi:uncharacterized protein (TIGR00159 family)